MAALKKNGTVNNCAAEMNCVAIFLKYFCLGDVTEQHTFVLLPNSSRTTLPLR